MYAIDAMLDYTTEKRRRALRKTCAMESCSTLTTRLAARRALARRIRERTTCTARKPHCANLSHRTHRNATNRRISRRIRAISVGKSGSQLARYASTTPPMRGAASRSRRLRSKAFRIRRAIWRGPGGGGLHCAHLCGNQSVCRVHPIILH